MTRRAGASWGPAAGREVAPAAGRQPIGQCSGSQRSERHRQQTESNGLPSTAAAEAPVAVRGTVAAAGCPWTGCSGGSGGGPHLGSSEPEAESGGRGPPLWPRRRGAEDSEASFVRRRRPLRGDGGGPVPGVRRLPPDSHLCECQAVVVAALAARWRVAPGAAVEAVAVEEACAVRPPRRWASGPVQLAQKLTLDWHKNCSASSRRLL